jgi:hypothetical protein
MNLHEDYASVASKGLQETTTAQGQDGQQQHPAGCAVYVLNQPELELPVKLATCAMPTVDQYTAPPDGAAATDSTQRTTGVQVPTFDRSEMDPFTAARRDAGHDAALGASDDATLTSETAPRRMRVHLVILSEEAKLEQLNDPHTLLGDLALATRRCDRAQLSCCAWCRLLHVWPCTQGCDKLCTAAQLHDPQGASFIDSKHRRLGCPATLTAAAITACSEQAVTCKL